MGEPLRAEDIELMRKIPEAVRSAKAAILQVYDLHNGEPVPKPKLICPMCNSSALRYGCDWHGSRHVYFECVPCEWVVME